MSTSSDVPFSRTRIEADGSNATNPATTPVSGGRYVSNAHPLCPWIALIGAGAESDLDLSDTMGLVSEPVN